MIAHTRHFWITLSQEIYLCVGTCYLVFNSENCDVLDSSNLLYSRGQSKLHCSQQAPRWVKDVHSSLKSQWFESLNRLLHRNSVFQLHCKELKRLPCFLNRETERVLTEFP